MDSLYRARKKFDQRRRPDHHRELKKFDTVLARLGYSHPYEMRLPDRIQFGRGLEGTQGTPVGNELFRLTSMRNLLRRTGLSRQRSENDRIVFDAAKKECRRLGGPVPLDWLVKGSLRGLRGFEFWTGLNLLDGDLERNAYRIGLPRNYIPPQNALVLICPASLFGGMMPTLNVPTPLDGFDFGMFYTTSHSPRPTEGTTLDLTDTDDLKSGVSEFVLGVLPAEYLSFVPVDLNLSTSAERRFEANSPLVSKLTDFFLAAGS